MRYYYALYASYGIHTVYDDNHVPTVHVFESAQDRDEWVADDVYDFGFHREACTAAEARKWARVWLDSDGECTRFPYEWEWRGRFWPRDKALELYRLVLLDRYSDLCGEAYGIKFDCRDESNYHKAGV